MKEQKDIKETFRHRAVEVRGIRIGEGIPKVCVPIVERTQEEILAAAVGIHREEMDMVEWRADFYLEGEDAEADRKILELLHHALGNTPVLFTFRTAGEGGEQEIAPEAYAELAAEIACSGQADLIDVEWALARPVLKAIREKEETVSGKRCPVILSNHDFHKTPPEEELLRRFRSMDRMGGDILKIAVMPQNKGDLLVLLAATREMYEECPKPLITMSMGSDGMLSRITGEIFGSSVTFGAAGKASAPGQVDVNHLNRALEMIHQLQDP